MCELILSLQDLGYIDSPRLIQRWVKSPVSNIKEVEYLQEPFPKTQQTNLPAFFFTKFRC